MATLAQIQAQRKTIGTPKASSGAGFTPLAGADAYGALEKYFAPQLKGLGWSGSVFDNSALMAGGGENGAPGGDVGMSQAFADFLQQNNLSTALAKGGDTNTLRLLQGDNVLGEQTYKTKNGLDKFADVAVPLAVALGTGGVFGQALGLVNPAMNPLDPSTWGGAASGGSGSATAAAEGGIGTLPGQAVPPITGPSGPIAAGAGGAGAGAATGGSVIDKILGSLGTAGGNLMDSISKDPLKALSLAGTAGLVLGNKPSGSPGFDAAGAASAQGDANKDASWFDAILNRPDMETPWGSSTWTLKEGADPKNPRPGDWVNKVALDPAQQQLLDSQNALSQGYADTASGMLGRVQDTYSQPLDLSSLLGMPDFSSINTDNDRARIEQALLDRLEPQLARDDERERTRLLNTGFEYGSEGTELALDRMGRQRNDARLAAIIQAGTEARGQADTQRANMLAQLQGRQQGFQEKAYERGLPLNELNALRGGSQVQAPEFQSVVPTNTAASPELDALLAQLGLKQSSAANSQAGYNALLQAIAGLGSAWIGGKP